MELSKEKELIKEAKKNPEVFGKLYEQHYSKIFGYILKRTADLEIAQDITSETFFKALKKLWQFRWRNISFSAWLYRIANNEIANYFRKNKNCSTSLDKLLEEKGFEPVTLHNPETEFLEAQEKLKKHQDFLEIQEKIFQLPIKYQEVITLRFFEKKKIKEIAEILGKKEGTIKSLLSRGLEKLRELIE
ncbi:RNA polymerase sigma factor [bacterium]|nr:RNA polymerase sigma factor [bacterium]